MSGPDPAVAAVRTAVRRRIADLPPQALVLVAVSGGADSLALSAATAFVAPRANLRAGAVLVDHGIQAGSAAVAERAAATCRELGLSPVLVVPVEVRATGDGPEAAAREARYKALSAAADATGAATVLLGHTRDDQAETVLLALARGSGTRSLAAMAGVRDRWRRPLLDVSRTTTRAACAALGLTVWQDPHNHDPRFTRVRARAILLRLEDELGPGVVAGLARTAALARDDADALDAWAAEAYATLGGEPDLDVQELARLPPALRRRVLLRAAGVGLTSTQLAAVDALVTDWHGQGEVLLPGGVAAARRDGRLRLGRRSPAVAGFPRGRHGHGR